MTDRPAEFIRPFRLRARLLLGGALGSLAAMAPSSAFAQAFNAAPSVVNGSVNITNGANTSTITVNSAQAVIDWAPTIGTFLPAGNTANYQAGGGIPNFAVLNRITNGQPTRLHAIAKERFKAEPSFWSRIIWRVSFVATRAAMPYGIMVLGMVNLLPVVVVLGAIGANVYWVSLVLKLRDLLREEEVVA